MLRVRAQISDFGQIINLLIVDEDVNGITVKEAAPLKFIPYREIVRNDRKPTLSFGFSGAFRGRDEFVLFIKDLIEIAERCCITMDKDFSKAERAAILNHLKDMRALVNVANKGALNNNP